MSAAASDAAALPQAARHPPPGDERAGRAAPASPAWERLEDQLAWYERNSARCKRWFHRLKVLQIVVAAAIPVTAALGASASVAGVLGAFIVVVEGLQQLFQYQQNWTGYRATAESLKHEKYLYLSRAGAYRDAEDPDALLAEHVEARVSTEHTAWVNEQRESAQPARSKP